MKVPDSVTLEIYFGYLIEKKAATKSHLVITQVFL